MANILSSVDVFSNPDNPWYYVVGAAFLVLILVMLTVYIVLSRKKNKKANDVETSAEEKAEDKSDAVSEEGELKTEQAEESNEVGDEIEQKDVDESTEVPVIEEDGKTPAEERSDGVAETGSEETPVVEQNDKEEKTEDEKASVEIEPEQEKTVEKKPVKKNTAKKAAETEASENIKVKESAKKQTAKKPAKTSKPFVDKLIETKAVHGIYNEIKNVALSYPGVKAKLGRNGEVFLYGTDKKAAVEIDGEEINLFLALDFDSAPSQFGLKKSESEELPVMMNVTSANIDTAQKAVVFAMNVSMLTRSSSHRHTDYVKKAMDAKARQKAKKM